MLFVRLVCSVVAGMERGDTHFFSVTKSDLLSHKQKEQNNFKRESKANVPEYFTFLRHCEHHTQNTQTHTQFPIQWWYCRIRSGRWMSFSSVYHHETKTLSQSRKMRILLFSRYYGKKGSYNSSQQTNAQINPISLSVTAFLFCTILNTRVTNICLGVCFCYLIYMHKMKCAKQTSFKNRDRENGKKSIWLQNTAYSNSVHFSFAVSVTAVYWMMAVDVFAPDFSFETTFL